MDGSPLRCRPEVLLPETFPAGGWKPQAEFSRREPEKSPDAAYRRGYPRIEAVFGGHDAFREPLVLDAEEFIAVKGFKAKGKRISTFDIETINELDPVRFAPAEQPQEQNDDVERIQISIRMPIRVTRILLMRLPGK